MTAQCPKYDCSANQGDAENPLPSCPQCGAELSPPTAAGPPPRPPSHAGTIFGASLILLAVLLAVRAAEVPEGYRETEGTEVPVTTLSGTGSMCLRYTANGRTYAPYGLWSVEGRAVTVRYPINDPGNGRPVYFLDRWGLALLLGVVGLVLVARGPGSEKT